MMNFFIIIGKLLELPTIKETPNGVKHATLLLDVERGFRNSDGTYENDKVAVEVWRGVAETATEHCSLGELLAIKGRIQSKEYQNAEGMTFINYDFIAEKVSFLANR